MCREHDRLIEYNYLFCLVESMESSVNFCGSKNQLRRNEKSRIMEFHSKRFCLISQLLMRHMPFKMNGNQWNGFILVEIYHFLYKSGLRVVG